MADLRKLVKSVTTHMQWLAVLKFCLLGVSFRLVTSAFLGNRVWLIELVGTVGWVIGLLVTKVFTDRKGFAISVIHQHNPDAEYSLDLLDRQDLNVVEQMQLERIAAKEISFPRREVYRGLWAYLGILLLATAINHGWWVLNGKSKRPESSRSEQAILPKTEREVAPRYHSAHVKVMPPTYTGLAGRGSGDLNISAIVGSGIEWAVRFSDPAGLSVYMINSRGEKVRLHESNGAFVHKDHISGSGLYSIKSYWKDSLIYQSDFYKLEALPDLAPRIEPASKELYRYHRLKDPKSITVSARISDDFKVRQAFIVATVARGSGENVKFREIRMPVGPTGFQEAKIQKTIDLNALNFTPGDELYYYWAAADNREPEPNFSKSDTYFIVYKDTAKIEEAELATMAVNIMPEYFRSQRQIIIDTERLISQRKKRKPKDFNATSNEIGFDQKLLRLRYGQYLGEEFETSIGGAENPAGPGDNGNIIDAFTHHSDGTGEGAEARSGEPAHADEHGHSHTHAQEPAGEKDPLAALMEQYTHAHDDAETNTFYEQSTRSLLKMALEQMWQSELHLRTYEPEKALPFEHKALEYLKTAQQKARTYVKKSGYDPPPIKEKEKRLTGELKELSGRWDSERQYDHLSMDRLAGSLLGLLEKEKVVGEDSGRMKALALELGQRMADSGPFNGGLQNWDTIAALQKVASGRSLTAPQMAALKRDLYKQTNADIRERPSWSGNKKLEAAFWKALK
nr:hypothetical protein [uncultured Dyadobacter sp.]